MTRGYRLAVSGFGEEKMEPWEHSTTCLTNCSRRGFLARLGWTGAALLVPDVAFAASASIAAEDRLFCLGSFDRADKGTLHLVAQRIGRWERLSSAATQRPMALAAHPLLPVIYVANGVAMYGHEPRGTVETFHVDRKNGRLELLARQPLSLSATEPRSLAVAPDGQNLLVAAFGGGAYNILSIDASGVAGAPSTILKQVGRGSHAANSSVAHPAAVLFHPRSGWAMGADFGADRLDFLSLQDSGSAVSGRLQCEPGSGLSALALDRKGCLAVAIQQLRPALLSFRATSSGVFVALGSALLDSVPTAIEFHREQSVVYCAIRGGSRCSLLQAWRIESTTGELEKMAAVPVPAADVRAIYCGRNTLTLASERGLLTVALDGAIAAPESVELAISIPGISSLVAVSGN